MVDARSILWNCPTWIPVRKIIWNSRLSAPPRRLPPICITRTRTNMVSVELSVKSHDSQNRGFLHIFSIELYMAQLSAVIEVRNIFAFAQFAEKLTVRCSFKLIRYVPIKSRSNSPQHSLQLSSSTQTQSRRNGVWRVWHVIRMNFVCQAKKCLRSKFLKGDRNLFCTSKQDLVSVCPCHLAFLNGNSQNLKHIAGSLTVLPRPTSMQISFPSPSCNGFQLVNWNPNAEKKAHWTK